LIKTERSSVRLLRFSLKYGFKALIRSRRRLSWFLFNFQRLFDPRLVIKPGYNIVKFRGPIVYPIGH
jgi:hypothetical protein